MKTIHKHDAGHMTTIATIQCPYMVKYSLKIFSPGTSGPISIKLGIKQRRLGPITFCSNDNLWLTLTYPTIRSNTMLFC